MKFCIIITLLVVLATIEARSPFRQMRFKKVSHRVSHRLAHRKMNHHRVSKKFQSGLRTSHQAKEQSRALTKSTPRRRDGVGILPVTPKGMDLDQHFGSQTETSPYGP